MHIGGGKYITHAKLKLGGAWIKGAFKYLGSVITEDLAEDEDVGRRIAAAAAAFGRFSRTVFRNKGLSLAAKGRAFSAFVLSQLLYQSECWALREDHERKLRKFFNRCLRAMTGVTWMQQQELHINCAQLAERLGLRTLRSLLDERCLVWAGHVARKEQNSLARQVLFGWCTVGETPL